MTGRFGAIVAAATSARFLLGATGASADGYKFCNPHKTKDWKEKTVGGDSKTICYFGKTGYKVDCDKFSHKKVVAVTYTKPSHKVKVAPKEKPKYGHYGNDYHKKAKFFPKHDRHGKLDKCVVKNSFKPGKCEVDRKYGHAGKKFYNSYCKA
jgi:hypothetical protein